MQRFIQPLPPARSQGPLRRRSPRHLGRDREEKVGLSCITRLRNEDDEDGDDIEGIGSGIYGRCRTKRGTDGLSERRVGDVCE